MEESLEKKQICCSPDLLSCGNGAALRDKLLLKPKVASGSVSLQTTRVPRSGVLDRLQNFLPKIALANENLRNQMEAVPAGHFDIENTEDAEKVIELDVALVELNDSESSELSEESSEDSSDSDSEHENDGETTIKLPGHCKSKMRANIEVLDKD